MSLPPLLVLTDRRRAAAAGRSLTATVAAAVDGGARAVILREKDLPRARRAGLAHRLRAVLAPVDGVLIAASDPTLPADGVHLAATDPPYADPPYAGPLAGLLVGRSCHSPAELARARALRCAYATLSPVAPTSSKPGYGPALGVQGLAALVRGTALPVYALGGVTAALVPGCRDAGAAGVAVMGAVMGAADPALAVADLLAAWCATA